MRKEKRTNSLAIAYVRVSTAQQLAFGVSLEAQEEKLAAYCTMTGLQLVNTLREEGVSATVALSDRPAGSQLLAALKSGVQHVVALKLDRLFRDAEDALYQTRAWDRQGVALHLVDFGGASINSGSALGRMLIGLLAGFAEFERNLIAERTTAALRHKRNHRRVFNHDPFGFSRDGNMLVPVEAEQLVVKQIQSWRADGLTLAAIAEELNSGNTPTKRAGGRWHARTIKNVLDSSLYGG